MLLSCDNLDCQMNIVVVPDNNSKGENMTKGSSVGSAQRKKLADISNLQQQARLSNQNVKLQQSISLSTKEYIEKLQKENMALIKIIEDRNKIIELSGIELQKLRINLQKLQQQNLHLAQVNSQMLGELNSGKDQLKALRHELGCKNGLLIAGKFQLEERTKTRTSQISENKVGTIKCIQAAESSQAGSEDTKDCNANKRRQSKKKSIDTVTVMLLPAKEKVHNKRLSERRQSSRFNQEQEQTDSLSEIDAKEKADEKRYINRVSLRRQSSKFQEPEPTGELCGGDDVKEKVDNKRQCVRRRSTRFKSQEPEATQDSFKIDEAKFPVSHLCDETVVSNTPTASGSLVPKDNKEGNNGSGVEAQESRRTSVGRPLRRAVEKVNSYKERSVKVKMRRED